MAGDGVCFEERISPMEKTGERRFCDLHVHSLYSDGENTPEELAAMGEEMGLSALALCDHNTVKGLSPFMKAGMGKGLLLVPGVEVTCEFMGKEVHMLGLFVRENRLREMEAYLKQISAFKEESNRTLAENLKKAGLPVDYAQIKAQAGEGFINRVHFAKAMVEAGYVSSVPEAFSNYLQEKHGLFVPAKRLDSLEVIDFLLSVKALPVLAHPFLSLSLEELLLFLPQAKARGLGGMETRYAKFTREQTELASALAQRFTLLESGGSDYHGSAKPDIRMGTGRGNLQVPAVFCEKLREQAAKI